MGIGSYGKRLLMMYQLKEKGVIKINLTEKPAKLMVKLTTKGKGMKTKNVERKMQWSKQEGKLVAVKEGDLKALTKIMGKVELASKPKENKLETKGRKNKINKKKKKKGKAV